MIRPPISESHTDQRNPAGLTAAELAAVSAVSLLASIVLLAYLIDLAGWTIRPFAILPLSVAAGGLAFAWSNRGARWNAGEVATFAGIVAAVLAWLLWLAWPDLLPVGKGPDLAHHLVLIDYIERHWRLVHEAPVGLGEMAHYTPGSQLLAALAGAWAGSNGFHAVHSVVAFSVALKAGLVFLVVLRLLPREVPRIPFGIAGALLLLAPHAYFVGSFTRDSFFAQVVSEMFAVGMWWALAVWEERPRAGAMALFALFGSAAFLTWPPWTGPLVLALLALVLARDELKPGQRLGHLLLGAGPIAAMAAVYTAGRVGLVGMVGVSGAVIRPSQVEFAWWFLLLSVVGLGLTVVRRHRRASVLLVAAIGAQAAVLFGLAKASGADTPYMALKMVYLVLYPLAAGAALALAAGWQGAVRASGSGTAGAWLRGRAGEPLAWVLVLLLGGAVVHPLVAAPRPTPVVSQPLYLAGQWARAHVQRACVDYLVAEGDTGYWLHLAVLGNPRAGPRMEQADAFDPHEAVVRWITPGGLPFAIADLRILPRDIRGNVDVIARFGPAVVIRRRGATSCPDGQ